MAKIAQNARFKLTTRKTREIVGREIPWRRGSRDVHCAISGVNGTLTEFRVEGCGRRHLIYRAPATECAYYSCTAVPRHNVESPRGIN